MLAVMGWSAAFARLAQGLDDLGELAAPRVCGGCGRLHRRWCPSCDEWLRTALADPALGPVARDVPGFPRCWSALAYDGPLVRALPAYKDDGRVDLLPPLATVLRHALAGMFDERPDLLRAAATRRLTLVCVPSSGRSVRERGRLPLADLVSAATRGSGLVIAPPSALRFARAVEDQAGLGAGRRADNLRGSMRAVPVHARTSVVLVDDIVTSGATLAEAARALRAAGVRTVQAVTPTAAVLRRAGEPASRSLERAAKFPAAGSSHRPDTTEVPTRRFVDGGPSVT